MKSNIKFYLYCLFLLMLTGGVQAEGVLLSPSSLSMSVGTTGKITVTAYSGTERVTSSNVSVATASYASGIVTVKGIKAGSAQIQVSDSKSSKKANVTVIGAQAVAMTVTPTALTLAVGSTGRIKVNNPLGTVSVNNSNAAVATASYANGIINVNAVKAGSATLTIKDSKTTLQVVVTVTRSPVSPPVSGNYTLLAWNDLGMHCMDGVDFSVFTILPPYNTLRAQLKDKAGKLITTGVKLTYEAVQDSTGSINTFSAGKTNFWENSGKLFGLSPPTDVGLNLDGLASNTPDPGNETLSLIPAPMTFNTEFKWFEAEGIPVTPFADNKDAQGNYVKNFYPTVKVVAKDLSGNILATTTTVLPVSDEMTCKGCHASTTSINPAQIAAKPRAGWVNDSTPEKDWKRNILRLHDEKKLFSDNTSVRALYTKALGIIGYNTGGLLATADSGKPVLCVGCHASNAYFDKRNKVSVMQGLNDPATGQALAIRPFTQVLHDKHALVKDPATQLALDSSGDRTACYLCHPGSKTQCLRGAMGKAKDAAGNALMSCQSCHGNMKAVASPSRQGWYQEPTCESCHNSGAPNRRATSGVKVDGTSVVPTDHTFATNANTPVPGLNLYRFSTGHGGLQCEACHGSTHAEYPSLHADENVQSLAVQGHEGTVAECTACHKIVPSTIHGGPHGMHSTGNTWVNAHQDAAEHGGTASCTYCHGTTAAGTPLSALKVTKTINAGEFGIKNWPKGYQVSCYSCHNGPKGD